MLLLSICRRVTAKRSITIQNAPDVSFALWEPLLCEADIFQLFFATSKEPLFINMDIASHRSHHNIQKVRDQNQHQGKDALDLVGLIVYG